MAYVGLIMLDVCVLPMQLLLYLKQGTYDFTDLFHLTVNILSLCATILLHSWLVPEWAMLM